MAKNIIDKANDEIGKSLAWVGTENKYANAVLGMLSRIGNLRKDPANAERISKKAKQLIAAYIGRSEYKAKREETKLMGALKELSKALMADDRQKLGPLVNEIKLDEDELTMFASRYTGGVRKTFEDFPDSMKNLKVEMQLLEEKPGDNKRKAAVQLAESDAADKLKTVTTELRALQKWTYALLINLRKAQKFLAGIQAKYLRAA